MSQLKEVVLLTSDTVYNLPKVISKMTLIGNEQCQVVHSGDRNMVVVEIGGTSLKLNTANFMMINEMMRKAAARLVMCAELN